MPGYFTLSDRYNQRGKVMPQYPFRIALIVCGLTASLPAWSVYKCTDASGRTVYQQTPCQNDTAQESLRIAPTPENTSSDAWNCDGRSICAQMTSCAEANFFLSQCGAAGLDADSDGIPCEDNPCDLGRAASLSLRPGEAAAMERRWREDQERAERISENRAEPTDPSDTPASRCVRAGREADRLHELRRGDVAENLDQVHAANARVRALRNYISTGCRTGYP